MDTVWALLRAARWRVVLAIAAGVASGLGVAALIALINTALATPRERVVEIVPAFAGLCLLVFVARTTSETMLVRLSQHLIAALRGELARQVIHSPLRQLEAHGPHRLLAALTEDVQRIAALLTRLPTFCINLAVVVGCLVYLAWLSGPWMLVGLAGLGLVVAGFVVVQTGAQHALDSSRAASDELYGQFLALTQGSKELQLNGPRRHAFLTGWLDETVARVRRHFVSGMTAYAVAESVGLLAFFTLIGVMLFAPSALGGQSAEVLTGFALTLLYLITPVEIIINLAPDFGQFRASLKAIGALQLSLHDETSLLPQQDACWSRLEHLQLRGVTHSYRSEYDDARFTLGPIDFSMRPGQIVFITGGNGSGKTTLAKLLTGLYAPEEGQLVVNDQVVGPGGREAYRQLFSAVFSDFHLFDSLLHAARATQHHFARRLLVSLRLDHKVTLDENGRFSTLALSQGQRKRLALLVAVLEDRPVLLFDEWAADQDPQFRCVYYTEVLPWLRAQGKLVIAITHDDAYFHLADLHVKLDAGRITQVQPPAALDAGAPHDLHAFAPPPRHARAPWPQREHTP